MDWTKSGFCGTDHVTEQCVEAQRIPNEDHLVCIRDTKYNERNGIPFNEMVTDTDSFAKFIRGVKAGEFDHLV